MEKKKRVKSGFLSLQTQYSQISKHSKQTQVKQANKPTENPATHHKNTFFVIYLIY